MREVTLLKKLLLASALQRLRGEGDQLLLRGGQARLRDSRGGLRRGAVAGRRSSWEQREA